MPTVEPFKPRPNYNRNACQSQPQLNPQTTQFCEKLGIADPLEKLIGKPIVLTEPVVNPDEIELEEEDEEPVDDRSNEVEKNDLFFVDTKPQKRNKMNLPQPQNETNEEDPQCAEKESVSVLSSTIEERGVVDTAGNEDIPTPIKKFKRRNQELYMDPEGST